MKEKKMKSVLLSLKPEWWERMKTGEKTLEIRRSRPVGVELPVRVIVYATKPVGMIVGEFLCGHFIRTDKLGGLVRRAMVPLDELCRYARGEEVFAWTVDDVAEYDRPVELAELGIKRPPQSWMYVEVDEFWPWGV